MKERFKKNARVGLMIGSVLWASKALAAGFQITDQSAVHLGTASAGSAAWAIDASSAFYNAAALTHIKDKQWVLSGIVRHGQTHFSATSSNVPEFLNPPGPVPVAGGLQTDAFSAYAPVPSLYYAARIKPNLVFGLSITAPFGLELEYKDDRVMRYIATRSDIKTINFSPSLAYKPTQRISLGLGPDLLFAEANLDAQANITGGEIAKDGHLKNHLSAWAVGWHAGLLVDVSQCTRLGLQYRSKYTLDGKGMAQQLMPAFPVPEAGALFFRNVSGKVTLPESLVVSAYHAFNPKWAMMADVQWTAWSQFKNIGLRYAAEPMVLNSFIQARNTDSPQHFTDTYRLALGVNYQWNSRWALRMGGAFDKSPVSDRYRSARIPVSDKISVAMGVSYTYCQWKIDVGYMHSFFKNALLNAHGVLNAATQLPIFSGNQVVGKYFTQADILGIQLRYDFV